MFDPFLRLDGGDQPLWSPDGKQVFYINGTRVMSVDLNTKSGFTAEPRTLFVRTVSSSWVDSGGWGHTFGVSGRRAGPVR